MPLTPELAKRLYDVGAEPLATVKELALALKALREALAATGLTEYCFDSCVGCGQYTEDDPGSPLPLEEHMPDCPVVVADALLARLL